MKDKAILSMDLTKHILNALNEWKEKNSISNENAKTYAPIIVNSLTMIIAETINVVCDE